MMKNHERRETIDAIYSMIVLKGKRVDEMRHCANLPQCSVDVLKFHSVTLVEIAENYGRNLEQEGFSPKEVYWGFVGIRKLYRGSANGLEEVALQGFFAPLETGETLPPGEKLHRFHDSTDGRTPKLEEKETFDAWLKYAAKELAGL